LSRQSEGLSASLASWNSSGAMNSTKNSSGSSVMSKCRKGMSAMAMPSPICTSGVEIFGSRSPIRFESSTAPNITRMYSKEFIVIL